MASGVKILKAAIPASATVGSLSGLGGGDEDDHRMTRYLQGRFAKPPYTMEKIQYPASMSSSSISDGVAAADYWARNTPGPKIIFGQSQGSQVASDLIDAYASDGTAPGPDELMFVLIGNPRDSLRGYAAAEGVNEVDGGVAQFVRTDTDYTLVQGKIRYDGWCDYPVDTSNYYARTNAELGKWSLHTRYPEWNLFDPRNIVWKENANTIHVLSHPDLFGMPRYNNDRIKPVACVKAARYARIESAYNRPSNDVRVRIPKPRNWLERVFMHLERLDDYVK